MFKSWRSWSACESKHWLAVRNWAAVVEFTNALRYMRRVRGMTREQLADSMNITAQFVDDIERGRAVFLESLVDYCVAGGAVLQLGVKPCEVE